MNQKAEFGQKSRQRLLQRKSNTYNLERGTALMEPILKSITIPGNRLAPIVTGAHHQSTLIFPCRRAFITKFNYQELTRFSSTLPVEDLVRWRKSEVRDNFGKNGEWWIQGDAYLRRAIVVDRIVDDFIGFHWDMIHTPCALGLLRVLEKNMRDDFSLAKTDETCIECAS